VQQLAYPQTRHATHTTTRLQAAHPRCPLSRPRPSSSRPTTTLGRPCRRPMLGPTTPHTQGPTWPMPCRRCHQEQPQLQLAQQGARRALCITTRRPPRRRHPWASWPQCPWWPQQQQQQVSSSNLGRQGWQAVQHSARQRLGPWPQQQQRWRRTLQGLPAAALPSRGPTGARWLRSQRLSHHLQRHTPPPAAAVAAGRQLPHLAQPQVVQRDQGARLGRRCCSRQARSCFSLVLLGSRTAQSATDFMGYGTVSSRLLRMRAGGGFSGRSKVPRVCH
jgi:hypothetical protein